jgi:hypothetical protein
MCHSQELLCETGKCIIKSQPDDGIFLAPRRFLPDCQHYHRIGQVNHSWHGGAEGQKLKSASCCRIEYHTISAFCLYLRRHLWKSLTSHKGDDNRLFHIFLAGKWSGRILSCSFEQHIRRGGENWSKEGQLCQYFDGRFLLWVLLKFKIFMMKLRVC